MKIAAIHEEDPETRCSIIPSMVEKFLSLNFSVEVEAGIGKDTFSDNLYKEAKAVVKSSRQDLLKDADIVLGVQKPTLSLISHMKRGAVWISFFSPFQEPELLESLAKAGITTISLDMMPRSTLAQKMDALSSQANLAGYESVILASEKLGKILPMMTTPAGTLSPAKVFVLGAGVAGLQAIATARRLGARVEAFDPRPSVEEQVKSLGAKFFKVDLGETLQTKEGYAKTLTPEQVAKQKEAMKKVLSSSDIVITTAQVFGKKAPILLDTEMLQVMQKGSVVVDLAIDSGGNVEGAKYNEEITLFGVRVVAYSQLARKLPYHASFLYSSNLYHFLAHFFQKETKTWQLNLKDPLLSCMVSHDGKNLFNKGS
jgi:NAD(P) transhydrogenase subunit alpha